MSLTTFIIPTVGRDTLERAQISAGRQAPVLTGLDEKGEGAGKVRAKLIKQVETEWVSMLDDDDTVTEDYVEKLQLEIDEHPEADLIHFREYFVETGQVFPAWPEIAYANIGISFSVKTKLALKHPFRSEPFEDYEFIKRLEQAGYNIFFSKYIVYHARH